jgi:DNA-binding beta-propeller fold protein YncE
MPPSWLLAAAAATAAASAAPLYTLDAAYPTGLAALNLSQVTACALVTTASGALELHVAQRGVSHPPFLVLDTAAGSLLRTYGAFGTTLKSPHGLASSQALAPSAPSTLWVTDIVNATVLQLDPASGQVLTLVGSKGLGTAPPQFSAPADLALASGGALWVSDGDGGAANRVLRLPAPAADPAAPAAPAIGHCDNPAANASAGCFSSPHSIAFSSAFGHVWVADRGNNRLQAFAGASGQHLATWEGAACLGVRGAQPWAVRVDEARGRLIVADGGPAGNPAGGEPGAVYVLAINEGAGWGEGSVPPCAGALLATLPVPNQATAKPHELAVDAVSGDIYLADIGEQPSTVTRWRAAAAAARV